ncbi:UDP-3-O-(3-hydroxymyristoyl)glucosamine N-acyltransferase [Halothermothrix orenii]|nr:UDP-3-O-(3-hydroxymyristoyl)glucosamine N-acyltransferase [Halothermothrix orenii]
MDREKNSYTARELAHLVGGELVGDPDLVIKGVSGVGESRPDTVTFAENSTYLDKAEQSRAGLVIVPEEIEESSKNIIRVKNPRLAFARIASHFAPDMLYRPGIDETAVISSTACIGEDVSIHPHVVIDKEAVIGDRVILAPGVYVGPGVEIGDDTVIHANVVIEYDTVIGSNVIIHGGTVIGSDGYGFVTDEKGHHKIPQLGNVIIEDNVEIGANVTVDRGTSGPTVIKQGTKIDNLVQVAHNVQVGEENLIVAQVGVAGSTRLGRRVTLAGKVGVAGHIELGDNSTIAAGSIVTKNTPSGVFYSGNPAHDHREELKEQAAKRRLPELLKKVKELEKRIQELERS